MGRFVVLLAVAGALWWLHQQGALPLPFGGTGVRQDGREVVLEAHDVKARFARIGSLEESYMLFGGDARPRRNSITHATVAGLPLRHARTIEARHPDFHLCSSPGASMAQSLTETLGFVAANGGARSALAEAVELHGERVRAGGDRTCIRVTGAPLVLEEVRLGPEREDVTGRVAPAFRQTDLYLAERVSVEDCRELLQ